MPTVKARRRTLKMRPAELMVAGPPLKRAWRSQGSPSPSRMSKMLDPTLFDTAMSPCPAASMLEER